ncbi:hypothetical protein P43SY_000912 [Pythium insidiosum]|uniref:Glutathione peroxidase n=1 Tax=Pythium insidiosum TaxID=114742 RepID=A0AAD5LGU7_PYTIN|nr:hypothetical protein P43SY_000912 [Pythium insidiosum]
MNKLPVGSGCDDDAAHQQLPLEEQEPMTTSFHSSPLPVAVAVPVSASVPAITRSRSGGSASGRRKTIHQFSFRSLVGNEIIRLADFAGKVVLIVNVASHCSSTSRAYLQLNELAQRFPELVIIGCPCNQFSHQENLNGEEILLSLRYIRPGNGFAPRFRLTEKVEVNGANAHAVFNFLKLSLPFPSDRTLFDEMSNPGGVFSHPMRIIWMPVSRADISWNFEKFLVGPDGVPFRRYSPKTDPKLLAEDIEKLMRGDIHAQE